MDNKNPSILNSYNVAAFDAKKPEGFFETAGSYAGDIVGFIPKLIREERAKTSFAIEFFGQLGKDQAIAYSASIPASTTMLYTNDCVTRTEVVLTGIKALVDSKVILADTYLWMVGMGQWEAAADIFPRYFPEPVVKSDFDKFISMLHAERVAATPQAEAKIEPEVKEGTVTLTKEQFDILMASVKHEGPVQDTSTPPAPPAPDTIDKKIPVTSVT